MTHSTHFFYGTKERFLFNDTLNTFYFTEGRKGFYLTMHSTHFIYGYMVKDHSDSQSRRKEGNVLFNDALDTFYFTEGRKCFI